MFVRVTLAVVLLLGACQTAPAPDSGFLEDSEKMVKEERLPFDRVWYDREVEFQSYTEIMVLPVNTEHLMAMSWWKETSFPGDRRAGARELGFRLQTRVYDAFEADPDKRFTPLAFAAKEPDEHTLLLEMALVELVPTRPVLSVLGGPTTLGKGSLAIEGRFVDARTGEVIAMFADRELARQSLINIKDVTWYAHAKVIIDQWADQLVAVTNAGPEGVVKRAPRFELKPW
jgi:hypothetical protein